VKHLVDADVIVVGGGHAGVEAAHVAARMGCDVVLVTHRFDRIGEMSCNPAIGGLGKGHLVAEIDALDGLMGRVADQAGIQFRLLNRRKGPAVRGPRAQCDRRLYRQAMQREIAATDRLSIVEAGVDDLLVEAGVVQGVRLEDGTAIRARQVVVTTGTFLRGRMFIGERVIEGGRAGDAAAVALARRIERMGLPLGRLKTGTPPRLHRNTIDLAALEQQHGDAEPTMFSVLSDGPVAQQTTCAITHTNEATHAIIHDNLNRSAMYSAAITGVGPRYCPSIEDKVVRFSDRTAHQVFLEPEGLDDDLIYPNGLSTSLPEDVQQAYIRSIAGLERAEIVRPGYAVDYVDPKCLWPSLETKPIPGLFFAGQINGTTGYEEAAAQGLVAGMNAARMARGDGRVVFDRKASYIGVLIDDLVTLGVSEPYRMFTSRAEHRLHLRVDNATRRLTPMGLEIGCVGEMREAWYHDYMLRFTAAETHARSNLVTPAQARQMGVDRAADGVRRSVYELIGIAGGLTEQILAASEELASHELRILMDLANDALYEPFLERQRRQWAAQQREDDMPLPPDQDYRAIPGLSAELGGKLDAIRPLTLGQARRIEGMTPAALALLLVHAKKSAMLA